MSHLHPPAHSNSHPAHLHICVDQPLADDFETRQAAYDRAREENPANGNAFELALETHKKWLPGRTLRVRFLGGEPAVQAKVAAIAQTWSQFANIHFAFGTDPQAEIRVAFQPGGSWSNIGTDAKSIAPDKATLNLGWLTAQTADAEYQRVVLHEFGHALGCIHEHQNPAGGIQWNKPVVYHDLATEQGWTPATIDHNLFERYAADQTQFSSFDRESIMLYPIRKTWTLDGFAVGWNRTLSAMDKAFIRTIYPF